MELLKDEVSRSTTLSHNFLCSKEKHPYMYSWVCVDKKVEGEKER